MARLHVIFDPDDKIVLMPDHQTHFGFKQAALDVPKDLSARNKDIYAVARKLAELLLEQL